MLGMREDQILFHHLILGRLCIAQTKDGVEKLSTESFSTNIGRCFGVDCFLLVAPGAFWRFALLANATSWAFFNGIEGYCNDLPLAGKPAFRIA
jgi:hypothetical protein